MLVMGHNGLPMIFNLLKGIPQKKKRTFEKIICLRFFLQNYGESILDIFKVFRLGIG